LIPRVRVAVRPSKSCTAKVMLRLTFAEVAAGVPLIAPVVEFRFRPEGRSPLWICQPATVPPAAWRAVL